MHQKECLRINLTKEEKDLCTENCKTPRRDTAEDRHKWTGALYDGPEEQRWNVYAAQSNLQTMQSLSRFQWPFFFFTKTEKTILTFSRNHKRPQIAKAILKNKTRVIILPDLNLHYKAMVIRTLWHLHKKAHRSMAQNWEPRKKPTCIWPINLRQRSQKHTTGKRPVSFTNTVGNPGQPHTGETNWTSVLLLQKKLAQNGLKPQM